MSNIATLQELEGRLDWELDDRERSIAEAALADLSDDARFFGASHWDASTAPRQVKSLILRAASRYMRNPDGYVQSRAGDETVQWSDGGEQAGTACFTPREEKIIGEISGRSPGILSVPLVAYGTMGSSNRGPRYVNPYDWDTGKRMGRAPTVDSGAPVPLFMEGDLG